jgi:glyoxylase-like metal-dependent hydrolase (beta-lactamase superfamily II)
MTDQDFNPPIGIAEDLEPGLRRVVAPNPSPMTFRGTNTYVLGTDKIVVIDPGPDDRRHLGALGQAIGSSTVSHILVTHAHLDHAPLAAALALKTGAPVLAFGSARAGRRPIMETLAAQGLSGGGEGIDQTFTPDRCLQDEEVIETPIGAIEAVWTPGHLSNHMCFRWNGACFTGDHVMGWASSLVSPPDGDLTAFMMSCDRLSAYPDRIYYPGHGAPIADPKARLDWLIAHRKGREAAILERLSKGPAAPDKIAQDIYLETPPALLPAATRNVFAHLIDLSERGVVHPDPTLSQDSTFHLSARK